MTEIDDGSGKATETEVDFTEYMAQSFDATQSWRARREAQEDLETSASDETRQILEEAGVVGELVDHARKHGESFGETSSGLELDPDSTLRFGVVRRRIDARRLTQLIIWGDRQGISEDMRAKIGRIRLALTLSDNATTREPAEVVRRAGELLDPLIAKQPILTSSSLRQQR